MNTQPIRGGSIKKYYALIILGVLPVLSSCSQIKVRQFAYETLRQVDCRGNRLEEFCSRNYASEFHNYERIRREFMRNQTQRVWRATLEEDLRPEPSITF